MLLKFTRFVVKCSDILSVYLNANYIFLLHTAQITLQLDYHFINKLIIYISIFYPPPDASYNAFCALKNASYIIKDAP